MSLDAWIEEQNLFGITKHQYCAGTDTTPSGSFRPPGDSFQIREVLEYGAPSGQGHSAWRHL